MRLRIPAGLFATVLALSLAPPALAWNGEAHQLVAWVAETRLSEKAKAGVKDMLGDAALSDAEVVSWADQIRRERRESAPWHSVNIPVDAAGYDPATHGNGGENVIDADRGVREGPGGPIGAEGGARRGASSCTSSATSTSRCTPPTATAIRAATGGS